MKRIIQFFINQVKVANLVVFFVILVGVLLFWRGQKEGFPNISFDVILITTPYFGASSQEVEQSITKKIEEAIDGVSGKKRLTSYSVEGLSTVVFEVDPDAGADNKDVINDIKTQLDRVKPDLPESLEADPVVLELSSEEFPVVSVVISGNIDEALLHEAADNFEQRLLQIDEVSKVRTLDYRDREIWVEVNAKKLKQYDLEIGDVIASIRSRNVSLPGGKIMLTGKEYLIRTAGQYEQLEDIENTVVRMNDKGRGVLVRDVAKVRLTFEETDRMNRVQGSKGIILQVLKKQSGDIIQTVNSIKNLMKDMEENNLLPEGVRLFTSDDLSFYVKRRLGILTQNATLGLILVFLCLIFFLEFKTTFWTTLGIPIAFCTAMIAVSAAGMTLNMMTMFGFIIVVGMIVDDAIVVAENVYRHREMGKPPMQAAVDGTREVFIPLTGMVFTTVIAFSPLLMIAGIMGKFLEFIPKVVIATMVASYFECLLILPGHLAHLRGRRARKGAGSAAPRDFKPKRQWFKKVQQFYVMTMRFLLKKPLLSILGIVVLCAGLLGFTFTQVPFVLFPGGIQELVVKIDCPKGNSLEQTKRVVDGVEFRLRQNVGDYIREYISTVGYYTNDNIEQTGTHYGSVRVVLKPGNEKEEETIIKLIEGEVKKVAGVEKYSVGQVQGGPPSPKPIFVQFFSEDLDQAERAANELAAWLKGTPNTSSILLSVEEGKEELQIQVDEDMASLMGVTINATAAAVRYAFEGGVATSSRSMKGLSEDTDIVVKYEEGTEQSERDIEQLLVKNRRGRQIALKEFADVTEGTSFSSIFREEQRRYISVSSELINPQDKENNSRRLNAQIQSMIPEMQRRYRGVSIEIGGDQEETQEQMGSAMTALGIALMGVLVILTALFKSYIQPFVVMGGIPFAFVGLMLGLMITGTPMGLFPLIGMVALTGVVVNDSMVLVSFINKRRLDGLELKEAIIDAGSKRLRPIILTTLTTSVGLIPLAYGILGSEPFLAPMAISILWGLTFASFVIIGVVPCIYFVADTFVQFVHRVLRIEYKLPGSVE